MGLIYNSDKFESCLNTFRGLYSNPAIDEYQGSVMIPLDFSLEMDGISGIIPHSAFEIPKDSLPKSYLTKKGESRIVFILHSIDHNVNNNKWTTKITGQTLNIRFDELTEAEKEAIKKAQTPAEVSVQTLLENVQNEASSIIVSSNSTVAGDNIPVVKYLKSLNQQNGRLASQYIRNLRIPDDPSSNRIHKLFPTAATQWERLVADARKAGFGTGIGPKSISISLLPDAAYRKPTKNNSMHGWGIAVDIQSLVTAQGGPKSFYNQARAREIRENNALYKWLNQNAGKYGWVNPSWAKDGVKMEETWHWEYHGPVN